MPVSKSRIDPYKNFKFRIKWNGNYVAAVSEVSGFTRTTQTLSYRDQESPIHTMPLPGQTKASAIILERGISYDTEFQQWANTIWDYSNTTTDNTSHSLQDFRKDIIIELYNEAGQKVLAYNVYNCWPSAYTALPELDGLGNAVAIQSLVLQNEGWERDTSIIEPTEPDFDKPRQ